MRQRYPKDVCHPTKVIPKRILGTIADGDDCASVEELHVNVVTGILGANPHLGVVSPF